MAYHFPTTSNLCYLLRGDEVLLIMKKRGLGEGKWNGPGGKVKEGENLESAVIREVFEETGYKPLNLENAGVIEFIWENGEWNQRCHIFICREFEGELRECDECLPKWFKISQIPLGEMWDDDKYWLKDVLSGGLVNKRFYFNAEAKVKIIKDINS